MVRAILAGTKTQTRRMVKPQPLGGAPTLLQHLLEHGHQRWATDEPDEEMVWKCPYGQPGDRLWVREAWRILGDSPTDTLDMFDSDDVQYRADDDQSYIDKYRPSIHMPRRFSRITLEVTGVRVERLQDISEADARAEGAEEAPLPMGIMYSQAAVMRTRYREGFGGLWCSISGPGSWDANPWVWVVEFKLLVPPKEMT